MSALTERAAPLVEFRDQLENRAMEFAHALPSHIKPEYFQRAALTAIAQNPKLLEVDRRSLLNALMRCAQDGLIPDGRQAALVIYRSKDRGPIAQYLPMVAGIRRLVQQSGEITRFDQVVVYSADTFAFQLGDRPQILHEPALTDRGHPVAVYSIAQFRDGTLSREVMHADEIAKVRQASRSGDSGPWVEWPDEMWKKTVAKRHAKVLPMSNEAADVLARDDGEFRPLTLPALPYQNRPRSTDRLETVGATPHPDTPKAKRGRPPKNDDPTDAEIERSQSRLGAVLDETPPDIVPDPEDDHSVSADFIAGENDAKAGRSGCLNRDIREDPKRFAEWQAGFDSVKRK